MSNPFASMNEPEPGNIISRPRRRRRWVGLVVLLLLLLVGGGVFWFAWGKRIGQASAIGEGEVTAGERSFISDSAEMLAA